MARHKKYYNLKKIIKLERKIWNHLAAASISKHKMFDPSNQISNGGGEIHVIIYRWAYAGIFEAGINNLLQICFYIGEEVIL